MEQLFDFQARARQAMLEAGFRLDMPRPPARAEATAPRSNVRDLRDWLWSSIDNAESMDLDQVEFARELPNGEIELSIGIADVDAFVPQGSDIDRYAAANTASVYCGAAVFPMLPLELSEDKTSLLECRDRLALVVTLNIRPDGGSEVLEIFRAVVRNKAKLSYSEVGSWLDKGGQIPAAILGEPGLEAQILLQKKASDRLKEMRKAMGALSFFTVEARPVTRDGKVVDLKLSEASSARDIVESFMIAANVGISTFLKSRGLPIVERIVRAPARWDRIQEIAGQYGWRLPAEPSPKALSEFLASRREADPRRYAEISLSVVKLVGPGEYRIEYPTGPQESHFGLAVNDYSHSTAPNRRYADMVVQRLVKSAIDETPLTYSEEELVEIAARCTERENAARKVERLMRKVTAAMILSQRVGQVFDGVVTGASPKGTYVRLLQWPAEGRVVQNAERIDVGDKIRVQLIATRPAQGFIDFRRIVP